MKISFANSSLARWLTGAVTAWRNRNRLQVTDAALPMQNVPEITAGWDYRPRGVVRQDVAFDCEGARSNEAVDASTPKEDDNVWFNFADSEAAAEQPPMTAPLSRDGGQL